MISTDANKELVRRLYDDYLNPGHLDRLNEIVSPGFVGAGPQRGPAAFSGTIGALRGAFPDLRYTVEDLVGDGDRVAVRWTWRGTHTGAFRGFAPTGKQVVNAGFAIFEITDGKLARAWLETDRLGFLLAIGAVPYDPRFGPPPSPAN
jgi:predicted ester cyclase